MISKNLEELSLKLSMYEALNKSLERQIREIKHGRNYDDDEAERKLNMLAERYRELEHRNKLLAHALYVANDQEEYYVYIPGEDNHLETLAYDIPVRISSTWLNELIEEAYEKGKKEGNKSEQN